MLNAEMLSALQMLIAATVRNEKCLEGRPGSRKAKAKEGHRTRHGPAPVLGVIPPKYEVSGGPTDADRRVIEVG